MYDASLEEWVECEEYYNDEYEEVEDYWETDSDFLDCEIGFNPYMGCYDWDC